MCRRRAFTLVELLVVIGVIALLIGMLLPALAASRRAAQSVACASQMRQIGAAFIRYTMENDGMLPYAARRRELGRPAEPAPWWRPDAG
jgi:prepilin-type N-terminal cleavage/methylation domain-containing protein